MIRMGMLDLQAGSDRSLEFLTGRSAKLGDDLLALRSILQNWHTGGPLDVRESGTLYRFVQYYCWLSNDPRKIATHGTLKNRQLYSDASVLKMSLKQLLRLDGGTSQWASAAVLFGVIKPKASDPIPYKLQVTIDAVRHWKNAHETNQSWQPRTDETIQNQAEAFYSWKKTGKMIFNPEQAEDFPFACAFGIMSPEEGERRWPQLRNHETDRIAEMTKLLNEQTIDSLDHRVVQALTMRFPERATTNQSKQAVNKTWPQFWDFLETTLHL